MMVNGYVYIGEWNDIISQQDKNISKMKMFVDTIGGLDINFIGPNFT